MDAATVVRQFNRTVTQRIGVLEDDYLSRCRPLSQSRLLWEIGPDGAQIRALRARLDLDSGYLSRLLRALEAAGLVVIESDPADRRVRMVRLTEAGRAERTELDRRADKLVADILAPLNERQRDRLTEAMADVERLLTASMVTVTVTDPRSVAAQRCLTAYAAELAQRFAHGYDRARTRRVDADDMTLPKGLLLVAVLHGEPIGCCALRFHGEAPAEIKRMWVTPAARGLGLGRRLIAEVESHARADGVRVLHLDTNRVLVEAINLYRSCGYTEVPAFNDEPYAHHWFEKMLE
ncbi:helix-turn-helix domain-containing GNAT family N-acetyltransferase [Mycobacterium sp.]|uniref:bifunctional helix-turn-helix transcriptional regulator/GNAT family N-acetyltransferase n=1 Tax=Mycobacterium sp. TaxID=1785 RepID=UPI002D624187|nr:helix-turn-helix domain-containing GNAT family N-acetyltransferase [Mycobacterium sp.]HZA09432.1 helix-turn-helix domain-containing GNAT family N-acetyltransferase [Mycobacterium sp.]